MKSLLAHHVSKPIFENWVETFGTSSFHLKILKKNLRSKIEYVHGTCCPNSHVRLWKASLGHPS